MKGAEWSTCAPSAGVGDVNGHNYSDSLVGAPGPSRACLYMSSPTGFPSSSISATRSSGSATSDKFGYAVVRQRPALPGG